MIGLSLSIAFVAWRSQTLSLSWRDSQVAIAESDLVAIKTILEIARLGQQKNGQQPFSWNALDSSTKNAIEKLTKGGELFLPRSADQVETEDTQGMGQSEFAHRWSFEPNGYNRLNLTCNLGLTFEDGKEPSLARRFSASEFTSLKLLDWLWAGSLFSGSMLLGLWLTATKVNRSRFLVSLAEWSNQPQLPIPLEGDRSTAAMERVDPNVAGFLRRASEGMHIRLETLQLSFEQSSRVMSAMPVGVLAFDQKLKLLFVNRAGGELLGLGTSLQFGQDMIEVIRQPTVVNLIQQVSDDPEIQEVELELPLSKATLRLRAHPLLDPDRFDAAATSSGVLLIVTDETRLKQLENARRDFTANVSHELKTPLSTIKAYAETLLMGALDDVEARQRFVERIAEQADRLDALIRDLLHLTKLQSQPGKPDLSNLSLDDVLKTCVEEHRTIGRNKNITIDTSGVEGGCRVEADLESLRTVIGNLLSNAVRYNHALGWVRVSTQREPDHVLLIIADNGIGIPPEDLGRIFERFYRVEKARSQDSGGTGLGLSIVKHLVQGMSAEIHVSSTLGKGSSFELKLKIASTEQ